MKLWNIDRYCRVFKPQQKIEPYHTETQCINPIIKNQPMTASKIYLLKNKIKSTLIARGIPYIRISSYTQRYTHSQITTMLFIKFGLIIFAWSPGRLMLLAWCYWCPWVMCDNALFANLMLKRHLFSFTFFFSLLNCMTRLNEYCGGIVSLQPFYP